MKKNFSKEYEMFLRQRYQQMRLIDNAIMNVAFKDNKEAMGVVLRAILDKEDLEIQSSEIQQFQGNISNRSVTFDIVATDRNGTVYNVEMQTCPEQASPKRARYHSSMLDQKVLDKGQDFEKLPNTYVIFITEGFALEEKENVIHIKRMMEHNKKDFNDGTHIIYVNAKNEDESTLGKVLHDLTCRDSSKMNSQILKDALDYAKGKESESMYIDGYCYNEKEVFDLGKEEGQIQGFKQGQEHKALDIAKNLFNLNLSTSEIATITGLSVDEIKALK